MKILDISTKIQVCSYDELQTAEKNLINSAKEAAKRAYAPYSNFRVGAAVLLENGEIITGNNQENEAYPSGMCAERVALFYASSAYPDIKISALAVAAFSDGHYTTLPVSPCGGCRQVMLETEKRLNAPIRMLLSGEKEVYIIERSSELLPYSFRL